MIKFLLFLVIFLVNSYSKEKCVKVFDEKNNVILDSKIKFTVLKKRNNTFSGNIITTFNPFLNIEITPTKREKNEICFENYKYKDENFIYDNLRNWQIYNNSSKINFNNFDSIPSEIILRSKKDTKKLKIDNNIQF